MKTIKITGLSLFLSIVVVAATQTTAVAAGRFSWESNYEKARQQATAESKPILAVFSASWCGPCQRLKRTTLADGSVQAMLSENFVPLMIDVDANRGLSRKFGVRSMPTVMVINPVTEQTEQTRGYQGTRQFLSFLDSKKQQVQLASGQQMEAPEMKTEPVTPAQNVSTSDAAQLTPYCLVTIVKEGKLVEGKSEFSVVREGLTARFASAENRDQFLATPSKYWPELAGACPVMLKETGKRMLGEARWAVEYDNNLFFCHTREHAQMFLQTPARYNIESVKVSLKTDTSKTSTIN